MPSPSSHISDSIAKMNGMEALFRPPHRFSFNGQERDDEVIGEGNSVSFKYRIHDTRLGRFLSIDPLSAKYAFNSPFAFAENKVGFGRELEGLEVPFFGWVEVFLISDAPKVVPNSSLIENAIRPVSEPVTPGLNPAPVATARNPITQMFENFRRGNAVEAEQLANNGIEKNTKPFTVETKPGEKTTTIPDGFKNNGKSTVEVKNTKYQGYTKQLKAQEKISNSNGLNPELLINKSAKVSKPLKNSTFDIKYYMPAPLVPKQEPILPPLAQPKSQ